MTTPPGLWYSTVPSSVLSSELHARAFDDLAADYDATFTDTALGRALRELVWLRFDDLFASCERVLDLGCGTGEDALRLARSGTRVVGIDASPDMVRAAQQKALAAGCAAHIDFHCVAMEHLSTALEGQSFDGVLSNFGAVNCVGDLRALIADVAARVAPAGRLLWVVMGRYVPWEWIWYGLRGDARKAWRRLPRGCAQWRGLTICYPTPAEMRQLLLPWFVVSRVSPLGFALPPSYTGPWLERSPYALAMLRRLEAALQGWSPLASLSDHYVIEAVRSSA
jgi:2-polyprenyl-3-methyl-5-hydroxy-6-metoxy-1,4-benzoquinol methylase